MEYLLSRFISSPLVTEMRHVSHMSRMEWPLYALLSDPMQVLMDHVRVLARATAVIIPSITWAPHCTSWYIFELRDILLRCSCLQCLLLRSFLCHNSTGAMRVCIARPAPARVLPARLFGHQHQPARVRSIVHEKDLTQIQICNLHDHTRSRCESLRVEALNERGESLCDA